MLSLTPDGTRDTRWVPMKGRVSPPSPTKTDQLGLGARRRHVAVRVGRSHSASAGSLVPHPAGAALANVRANDSAAPPRTRPSVAGCTAVRSISRWEPRTAGSRRNVVEGVGAARASASVSEASRSTA